MNTAFSSMLRVFRQAIGGAALLLASAAFAQIQGAVWHSKTAGPAGQLMAFFPKPNTVSGSPELLGPRRQLLADGRLRVWVGRSDGTSLPGVTVTLRVPETGNVLVSDGARVTNVTVQANEHGIAEVRIAAPDVPPISTGDGDGGEGGGGEVPVP
jgi:hypothetical protein